MKRKRYVWQPIVIGGTLICMLGQGVFAKESEKSYTYTVTLYAGNQGILSEETGITVDNHLTGSKYQINTLEHEGTKLCITGLQYGDVVSVNASTAVKLKQDSPYYAKGVRESGRDNGTVGASAFPVKEDQSYVVAYGIKGDMVSYIVNYQDTQGKVLAESQKFYGIVGEQPVVAFRYIENYQPQAYNLTRTLRKNEAENVFTFVYQENSNETPIREESYSIAQSENPRVNQRNAAAQNQAGEVPAEDERKITQDGEAENGVEGIAEGEEEENEREMKQDNAKEGEKVKDIINLDEEETAEKEKISEKEERSGKKETETGAKEASKKNIPIYLGIGAVTAGGGGALAYGIVRRKRGKGKKDSGEKE